MVRKTISIIGKQGIVQDILHKYHPEEMVTYLDDID
jgi:hypothetical protein